MTNTTDYIVEASTSERAVIVKEDGRFFILTRMDIWIPFWKPVVSLDIELTLPNGICILVIDDNDVIGFIRSDAYGKKLELKYKRPFLFRKFKRGDKLGHLLILGSPDVFFIGLQESIEGGIITMEV